jgi:hypothetical protein
MSGEIFTPREFDSPPGEAAAGSEVTGSGQRLKLIERSQLWQLRRALGWRAEPALRIEKQRNLVRACDLVIGIEKADLSKI